VGKKLIHEMFFIIKVGITPWRKYAQTHGAEENSWTYEGGSKRAVERYSNISRQQNSND
jgi:hypothetical protein